MDISVLTSSTEGLSITLLESMRHGLPTVVTLVGGNPEVVQDGVTGFLVPLGDEPDFVRRVVELVQDAGKRLAMGGAARERVATHFDIDRVARRYLETYEELLDAGGTQPARSSDFLQALEMNA
jgi:glycosyltransferase involved in cell wall biosynthesis